MKLLTTVGTTTLFALSSVTTLHGRSLLIPAQPITVMAVGGSNAAGWGDSSRRGGYLKIAFDELGKDKYGTYHFVNKSVAGAGPVQYAPIFPMLLKQVKPQIVIFAYGILDDVAKHTPMKTFRIQLHRQMTESLQQSDNVILTTPPISRASLTINRTQVNQYVSNEIEIAQELHNPHVYIYNLNLQMEQYGLRHHKDFNVYFRDNWHLNSAGHALAGELLASDMENSFPKPRV